MTGRALARRLFVLLCVLGLSLLAVACKRRPRDELAAQLAADDKHAKAALPPLALQDDTPDLLLTWLDKNGDPHEATKPADVPMEGRDEVRVIVSTKDEGTRDELYVANLTVKSPDGTYPVATMTRVEWEATMAKRREALLAARAPPAGEPPAPPGGSAGQSAPSPQGPLTVIVYGAAWCEACHQAVAHLKRRRIPVVEKDIEKDPSAEAEMRAKLARAGIRTGSIPILDVRGKILVGYEPHALDQAIVGAGSVAL
jgi:glutaredoxin